MSVPSNWNAAITENVAPIDNKNNASHKNYKNMQNIGMVIYAMQIEEQIYQSISLTYILLLDQ